VPLALGVIGANMQCELFVALQLKVAHHFIERCPGERTRRFEPPATFGATKTSKTLLLNPYQLPAHGRHIAAPQRCLTVCLVTARHRDEAFSFRSGVLPDCSRKTVTQSGGGGRCVNERGSLHAPIWMVCRTSYIHGRFLFARTPDFGALVEVAE
jgi:hypothetical protein